MAGIIGGKVCKQPLANRLLHVDPRELTRAEIDGLWKIFVEIGAAWDNTVHHSAGLKSSWLEFIKEKSLRKPSFVAEYVNAIEVVEELVKMYRKKAFHKLFFENGLAVDRNGNPVSLDTRLAHAKHFVVDEFIRVQIIAGGYKNFIRQTTSKIRPENIVNYNGFIAGSRYNRIKPVRSFKEADK